jgi:hypothetical protein
MCKLQQIMLSHNPFNPNRNPFKRLLQNLLQRAHRQLAPIVAQRMKLVPCSAKNAVKNYFSQQTLS